MGSFKNKNSYRTALAERLKPGQNTGPDGGIFAEVGPRGGLKCNYAAIPDNHTVPPTSQPGNSWLRIKRTPDSLNKKPR